MTFVLAMLLFWLTLAVMLIAWLAYKSIEKLRGVRSSRARCRDGPSLIRRDTVGSWHNQPKLPHVLGTCRALRMGAARST